MEHFDLPAPPASVQRAVWPAACGTGAGGAGAVSPPRDKRHYLVLAPVRGTLTAAADETFAFGPLDALLLPPDQPCALTAGGDYQADYLLLAGELAAALLEETRQVGGLRLPGCGEAVRAAAAVLRHPGRSGQTDPLAASATAYQLLMQLYRHSAPAPMDAYPALVRDAIAIMQHEFAYLYGVEELAGRLMVTKHHLIRVFSAAVGMPPGQYLTRVRVEEAKKLLHSRDATLELVAAATGFSSAGYFGKVFRRETGVTPARYAAAVRQGAPLPDALYL